MIENLLAKDINGLEPRLTREGYNIKVLAELLKAKPREIPAGPTEHKALTRVDPLKGKFRSLLLASVQNFLSDEADRARRKKRGGDREFVRMDAESAEECYRLEPFARARQSASGGVRSLLR